MLTADDLRKLRELRELLLDYDPETGTFRPKSLGSVVGRDARYYYHQDDNLLNGREEICTYLRVSPFELDRLIKQQDFPAIHLPDGRFISSMQSVDHWLFLTAERTAKPKPTIAEMADKRENSLRQKYTAPGYWKAWVTYWQRRLKKLKALEANGEPGPGERTLAENIALAEKGLAQALEDQAYHTATGRDPRQFRDS